MGYNHFFFRGSQDGLESLFFTHLSSFTECYWTWYMAEEEHYTAAEISELEELSANGRSALRITTQEQGRLIDQLVLRFLIDYCDTMEHDNVRILGKVKGSFSGWLSSDGAAKKIEACKNRHADHLWGAVKFGRSLSYGLDHYKFDGAKGRYGYWTFEEARCLVPVLAEVLQRGPVLDDAEEEQKACWAVTAALNGIQSALECSTGVVMYGA